MAEGIRNVAVSVLIAVTGTKTQKERLVAFNDGQMSLLAQDQEEYARWCTTLASAKDKTIDLGKLQSEVLIVAREGRVSPKTWAQKLKETLVGSLLPDVGHWHCFEEVDVVALAIKSML